MKLFILLFSILIAQHIYSQNPFEGKWYVENKKSLSDFDIPEEIILTKDSSAFDSKSMVDSMYCLEYFIFEPDSNFNCIGECHAYDPQNNWFSFYGSYGMWELENTETLKLDYVHGYHITHCEFKIRRRRKKVVLTRSKMETVEIKMEKDLKEQNK